MRSSQTEWLTQSYLRLQRQRWSPWCSWLRLQSTTWGNPLRRHSAEELNNRTRSHWQTSTNKLTVNQPTSVENDFSVQLGQSKQPILTGSKWFYSGFTGYCFFVYVKQLFLCLKCAVWTSCYLNFLKLMKLKCVCGVNLIDVLFSLLRNVVTHVRGSR